MSSIGIDLGTTFSCVAVVKNGQVQTIYNQQGSFVTPSWVSFTEDDEILVGEPARIAAARNMKNTVFNIKRLIGRSFDEWERERENLGSQQCWPFQIVKCNDKPYVKVKYRKKEQVFSPEEISSFILKDLKHSAEDFLHSPVSNAVISVPANFNYAQRKATEEAAKLAGLNVLRLCSEPAMAGMMHEPLKNIYDRKTVLVFDCGGGTTDVAILSISEDGTYDIVSTGGNMNLGGETIVERLLKYYLDLLKEETKKDYSNNEEAVRRLRRTCEEAKCQLSFAETFTVCFDYLCEPRAWKLTRNKFNVMMADLFEKMLETVSEALSSGGLTKNQIDDVLLAGGTTRILELQRRLSEFFEGKPLYKSVNPEQAIAQGAAVMAAFLSGDNSASLASRQLSEVAPLSLNVEVLHGAMFRVVPRNTKLPVNVEIHLYNTDDDSTSTLIGVFEGERALATDNEQGYLGDLALENLPKARKGERLLRVKFAVSASGILEVTAHEPTSGASWSLQVLSKNRQRFSKPVLEMVEDANRNIAMDVYHRQRLSELNAFHDLVYLYKHQEEDQPSICQQQILDACNKALDWIFSNNITATPIEVANRKAQFQAFVESLRSRPPSVRKARHPRLS